MYRTIRINAGDGGWGGPLTVTPTKECHFVLCLTAGGIHPVAQKLAELSGGTVVDGFKTSLPAEQTMIAVVDCGGTARCGVYPKKGIFTVNVMPVGQSGPLAAFMTPNIYVSAVREKNIEVLDSTSNPKGQNNIEVLDDISNPEEQNNNIEVFDSISNPEEQTKKESPVSDKDKSANIVVRIGQGVGLVISKFYQAGRESIDMVLKNVLPFMAFTSTLLGIITATGLGDLIARTISPLCGTIPGMLLISVICSLPFLSPILGPGAVIAQVIGTLLGAQFATGAIPPQYALPALFAIDSQAGADFVPVGLSLGEAEPDTVEMGVPAVLFSRMITGPLAVLIALVIMSICNN